MERGAKKVEWKEKKGESVWEDQRVKARVLKCRNAAGRDNVKKNVVAKWGCHA